MVGKEECEMNSNLINLIQLMLLVICFTSIFCYVVYSYKNLKHTAEENATRNILIQWFEFIRKLPPKDYIIYEKYGIWHMEI
jgi:flagellar basal body-associated protein FliL